MAKTMKAAVLDKPRELNIREVPVPTITDDDVLIRVRYTGICGTDWSIYTGKYSSEYLPFTPGHEFSGEIAQKGKNARGIKEGDRVTADINMSSGTSFYDRRGQKLLSPDFRQLGIHMDGTYAEYVKVPWQQVHRLPDSLTLLQGAFVEPVSCVIHSAKALELKMGSNIVILGARLGILHAAVAKYRGAAPVIVIGRNKAKLEIAKQLGADVIISTLDDVDPIEEVMKLTEGRGADYVVESVGTTETYEQAFRMVRRGGRLAAFGITNAQDEMTIRPFDIVLGERSIVGSCAGVGLDWDDSIKLIEYGRIKPEPMFSMIVPLEELEPALHELQENPDLTKIFVSADVSEREVLNG